MLKAFQILFVVVLGLGCTPLLHAENQTKGKPLQIVIAYGQGKRQLQDYGKYLEKNFHVKVHFVEAQKSKKARKDKKHSETPFQGIEAFAKADVILSNLYRTWAPPKELAILKKAYTTKPVVGMRKAHHGFQNWLEADKIVFGVDYRGHYGNAKNGYLEIVEKYKNHPFFKGMKVTIPGGGCYGHRDPAPDLEVYAIGGKKGQPPHPQIWSRVVKQRANQRVFYTRYDPNDLAKNPGVREMVTRAIFWAAQRDIEKMRKQ